MLWCIMVPSFPPVKPKDHRAVRTDGWALAAFAFTGALGTVLGWSTEDIVWGLLLTSFVACSVGLILGIGSGVRLWLPRLFAEWPEYKAGTVMIMAVGSFMAAVAFVFVAGAIVMLHTMYVFLVYSLFPFWPATPNPFELSSEEQFRMLRTVVVRYWPFALVALVSEWKRILRPLRTPKHLDFARPLLGLGRLHVFVILAMTVAGIAGTGLALYWLVLFFYFFPWEALPLRNRFRRWWGTRRVGAAS
jgi:hypothetical protein